MSGWGDPPTQGPQDPYRTQGYGPGYGQYPPYGGYYPAAETDGKAVWALVAGIASYVLCPLVPAIVALMLAGESDREIASSGGRLTGATLNKVARVLAWINVGLSALFLLFFLSAGAAFALGTAG